MTRMLVAPGRFMLGITVCLLTILPSSQSRGEKYVAAGFIHAGYPFKPDSHSRYKVCLKNLSLRHVERDI